MGFLDDLKGSGSAPRIKFDGRDGTYTKYGSEENIAGQEWVAHIYRASRWALEVQRQGHPARPQDGSHLPEGRSALA
jgi:hypothetical protein